MRIKEVVRGALHRVAGVRAPAFFVAAITAMRGDYASSQQKRKTAPLPSALTYSSRLDALPKPTPTNLRKFAETPVARKAINTIKDRVACMKWRVQPKNGRSIAEIPNGVERV